MNSIRYFSIMAVGASLALAASASADPLDGILEVVNDSPITFLEVQDRIDTEGLSRIYSGPQLQQEMVKLRAQQLEELVQHKLILYDFLGKGYMTNVLDQAVEAQINNIIKQSTGGDHAQFIQSLQKEGRTMESFRRQQREDFIVNYATYPYTQQGESHKIIISPLKIQSYYHDHLDEFKVDDQVKLGMITIGQTPDGPPARQVAGDALRKIDSGVPFDEMAAEISSDAFRAKGGDRGWVLRKDYVPALSDVAFSLKAGQHSQVVELKDEQHGASTCFLLRVEDVKPAHTQALSEVQTAIEKTLMAQEGRRLLDQWLVRLRAKSQTTTF